VQLIAAALSRLIALPKRSIHTSAELCGCAAA